MNSYLMPNGEVATVKPSGSLYELRFGELRSSERMMITYYQLSRMVNSGMLRAIPRGSDEQKESHGN